MKRPISACLNDTLADLVIRYVPYHERVIDTYRSVARMYISSTLPNTAPYSRLNRFLLNIEKFVASLDHGIWAEEFERFRRYTRRFDVMVDIIVDEINHFLDSRRLIASIRDAWCPYCGMLEMRDPMHDRVVCLSDRLEENEITCFECGCSFGVSNEPIPMSWTDDEASDEWLSTNYLCVECWSN